MRIISGKLGGRSLLSLSGPDTRPAMGKTRESLFSMLESRGIAWEKLEVLDLFAGTGSLALEAISRGAPHAVMVDSGHEQCRVMARNAEALGVSPQCRIVEEDVLRFLRRPPDCRFDLAFVDPPYRRSLGPRALTALAAGAWLNPDALVVAELEKDIHLDTPAGLEPAAERQFGQTILRFWTAS